MYVLRRRLIGEGSERRGRKIKCIFALFLFPSLGCISAAHQTNAVFQGGRIPHPSIIWARRAERLSGGDRSRCTTVYAYAIDVRPPPICVRTASFVAPVGTSPSSFSFRPRLNIAVSIGVEKKYYFHFQKRNNETNANIFTQCRQPASSV